MQYGYDANNKTVIDLTVGSCGDCRIILCDSKDGSAIEMTRDHHGTVEEEAERIESFGGEILDMYGKIRVEGQLEPTRALGDATFKKYGVWAERTWSVNLSLTPLAELSYLKDYPADDLAFMVLVTDGIKQSMSSQEIVDTLKTCPTPSFAASKLVDQAETLNVDDNKTALIVRFDGWCLAASGKVPDLTRTVRARRLAKYQNRRSAAKELAEDEDVDVEVFGSGGMSRADTEEERRACLDEVFTMFKEKQIAKQPLLHALKSLGIDLDDAAAPDYDEDEEIYETWLEDRHDVLVRQNKTTQVVDKMFTVRNQQELSKDDLLGAMNLMGVWVERHH
jgi:serine/threonine protein phosphatase PrpC